MISKFERHNIGDVIFIRKVLGGTWYRIRIESTTVDSDGDMYGSWLDDPTSDYDPIYFNKGTTCHSMGNIVDAAVLL